MLMLFSLYLVSERESAVDVQTVVTLKFQQGVAQKFLIRQKNRQYLKWEI